MPSQGTAEGMLLFLSKCCVVLARYSEYSAGAVAGVEEAEAKAALIGLHALKDLQGPVILEFDCQIRIKELMTGKQSLSPCYGLLRDIKQALTNFSDHSISSVGRLCNALADELAALAKNSEHQERIADVPDCLRPLMISEFMVSAEQLYYSESQKEKGCASPSDNHGNFKG